MDLGLSQRKLARLLGVSNSTVENWELNETTPVRWLAPRILQFLGIDPPKRASLGERLTDYRRSLGLSQGELARSLGVERCTVVRWETGKRYPSKALLTRIETLGMAPDQVAGVLSVGRHPI